MELLEAGRIVGTHGVRGELKLECWCDGPEFLTGVQTLYLDGRALQVLSARPHKGQLLLKLEGITAIEQVQELRGKVLCFDREDVELPEDRYYIQDLEGCTVVDDATGETVGVLKEVLQLPAQDVYVVRGKEREILIPAVDAFIAAVDTEAQLIRVRMMEGL